MPTPEAPPRATVYLRGGHDDGELRDPLDNDPPPCIGGDHDGDDYDMRGLRGQLWQREAERDVREHGEAVKAGRLETVRRGGRVSDDHEFPSSKRGFIREQIERRRPAMRARRAELDARA